MASKDLNSDEDLSSDEDLNFDRYLIFDEDFGSEEHLNTIEDPNLVDKNFNPDNNPYSDDDLNSDEDVKEVQYKRQLRAQYKRQLAQSKRRLSQRETQLIQRERRLSWQREKQYKGHLVKCKIQLAKREAKLAEITKKWKQGRKITINLLRTLADQIQKHEDNSRIAKLTGSSASIAGTCIAVGGAVASIFTFGASLIVTLVGVGIAAGGGVTLLGTDLVNSLLRTSNTKLIDEALKRDKEATHEFENEMNETQKLLEEIMSSLSTKDLISKIVGIAAAIGKPSFAAFRTGLQLGGAGAGAGETAFGALGTASKALHFAGIAFSAITLMADIYTLVSTSVEVHNGSILKVVQDIREAAQKLEDELNICDDEHEDISSQRLLMECSELYFYLEISETVFVSNYIY